MKKERLLLSLLELKQQAQKDALSGNQSPLKLRSSIGLIIDCSNVYKYQSNRDYTQKLKIIDNTSCEEPTQVYIWSNKKQDFTLNIKIGDILFFNNFKNEVYKGSLQAKKVYKNEDSYFRIFSGNPQLKSYSPIDKKVGLDDQDGSILSALGNLRAFSKNFFKLNRVPIYFKQDEKGEQKATISSDFDAILRVIQTVQAHDHYKIRLTDQKEEFHLNYTRHIDPGVYKVRSIAEIKWEDKYCSLSGNDYTFFLQISNWMRSYNANEWQRMSRKSQKSKKAVKRDKIQTRIVASNIKNIKKVTLKELFSRDNHEQEVRVTCEVMDILTSFQDALKKYDAVNHTQKSKDSEVGEFIYSIHLLISDQSIAGQVCNVYIYTYDQKGLEFLPQLHPSHIFGRNTLGIKEKYDEFVNRLLEESDIQTAPIQIVLSPLFNGRETIYRIVNTQLLF